MNENPPALKGKLKLSGVLLLAGLCVELITMYWASPASFLWFALVGGTLVAVGILMYLIAIVSA